MTVPARSYTTTFLVERPAQEVFDAVNDVAGWWSQEVVGVTDQVGGEFDYHYRDAHRCTLRVTELVPGRRVAWRVLSNHFDFVEDQDEWTGTDIVFDITQGEEATEVRFTHAGLVSQLECYDVCSNAWAGYVHGSLRNLILTGTGRPNPREGPTPEHQETANGHRARRSVAIADAAAGR